MLPHTFLYYSHSKVKLNFVCLQENNFKSRSSPPICIDGLVAGGSAERWLQAGVGPPRHAQEGGQLLG
jgi:hypothetical protein